jgi:hypothetical protein
LRRIGGGYAVRAGWLARGLGADRRGGDFAEDELWESVVDDDVEMDHHHPGGDEAAAMESLAMAVSNIAQRHHQQQQQRGSSDSRQRWLEAGRQYAQSVRGGPVPAANAIVVVDPNELLRCACDNAQAYQPVWENFAKSPARSRAANGIQVGDGERQTLAHLPMGVGEGLAVRASEPLPRGDSLLSTTTLTATTAASVAAATSTFDPSVTRRVVGFRVAFDHPSCEQGGNMGGCYLVGITNSSFTAYGEQNGLHHSPFFWGIEDGGIKYEGSRYAPSGRGSRRSAPSVSFGIEISPGEVPRNQAGVRFGAMISF